MILRAMHIPDETQEVIAEEDSFQITYNMIRTPDDITVATYDLELGLWRDRLGVEWTDIVIEP